MDPNTNLSTVQQSDDYSLAYHLSQSIKYLLLVSILMLPFVGGAIPYLVSINVLPKGANPVAGVYVWLKVTIDIAFALSGVLLASYAGLRRYIIIPRNRFLFLFFVVVLVSLLPSLLSDPVLALAGVRFFYPVVFYFAGLWLFTKRDVQILCRIFVLMSLVAALLGISQYFLSGAYATGRVAEHYGIYSVFTFPSSFSSILGLAGAIIIASKDWSITWRVIWLGILIIAILLSKSGTGIAVLVTILVVWVHRNRSSLWIFAIASVGIALMPIITGRSNIWSSLQTRGRILFTVIQEGSIAQILFGRGAGVGTDISVTLRRLGVLSGQTMISDSLFNALVIQVGVVGLVAFLMFTLTLVASTKRVKSDLYLLVMYTLPVVLAISVTRNIFELFPVNLMFWIICGAYMAQATDIAVD